MKMKVLGTALFALTLGVIVYYPQLRANTVSVDPQAGNGRAHEMSDSARRAEAVSRRGSNYNRFMEIEEELGSAAVYAGRNYIRLP